MPYYVIARQSADSGKFTFFGGEPDDFDRSTWRTGAPVDPVPPPLVVTAHGKQPPLISDAAHSVLDTPVFSPKLRALLAHLGATNLQYVPVTLRAPAAKMQTDTYQLVNVLGLEDCIDLKKSQIERSSKTGRIMALEAFRIVDNRVVPLPGMSEPPVIFRLKDYTSLVIVSEAVKSACAYDGITGLKFVPTIDWY